MSEDQKKSKPRRNHKRERAIQEIIDNAAKGGGNRVARELTFQQAFSIHLRSRQLIEEGRDRPHLISDSKKAEQIDACYEQRMR